MPATRRLLLCKSVHHGNTAKIARAIASALGAELATPETVSYASLSACDLLGVGSGVYYGRMHEALFEWLFGLPDDPEARTPAFIFSTSGLPMFARFWHGPLRRLLKRKGFSVIGEFACGGYDTWGPLWLTGGLNRSHPDENDLNRAKQFAARLVRDGQTTANPPGSPPAHAIASITWTAARGHASYVIRSVSNARRR